MRSTSNYFRAKDQSKLILLLLKPSITKKNDGNILDLNKVMFPFDGISNAKLADQIFFTSFEKEFFHAMKTINKPFSALLAKRLLPILELENIVEVFRNRDEFTTEQNQHIDIVCYSNSLKIAAEQGRLKIPCEHHLPELPDSLRGEKFSDMIHFLEEKQTAWASLAAAFLLADLIETHVDLTGKTTEATQEYWHKRYHDGISFAQKAVELDPGMKTSISMFLLHLKAIAAESYPDINQRINFLYLEKNSTKALLQYKKDLFIIKPEEEIEESHSQFSSTNQISQLIIP